MRTSFDEVCMASKQRHYTVREMVSNGLKSRPQPDQNESDLQSMVDRATTEMRDFLLEDLEVPENLLSAEAFAERWDYLLWVQYSKFDLLLYRRRPIPARLA